MKFLRLLVFLFLSYFLSNAAGYAAAPIQAVRIGPIDAVKFDIALILSSNAVKKCAGQFRGQLKAYDVAMTVAFAGNLKSAAGACELSAAVPWRGISEKVAQQARGDVLHLSFVGELVDGKSINTVNWAVAATKANLVLTEPMKETVKRFARATDVQVGTISLRDSTVNADINVQSPLGFDLRVQKISCLLEIHGAVVAMGSKESFVLASAGRPTALRVPVTIDHKALLSATGNVIMQMGKVSGKLSGSVRVRTPSGEVDFPMEFPVQLKLI